jgi:hypothetical protein
MEQDLYSRLADDLILLFRDLKQDKPRAKRRMEKILQDAHLIGGVVEKEALQLCSDVEAFLKNPEETAILKRHALKLKREMREI